MCFKPPAGNSFRAVRVHQLVASSGKDQPECLRKHLTKQFTAWFFLQRYFCYRSLGNIRLGMNSKRLRIQA